MFSKGAAALALAVFLALTGGTASAQHPSNAAISGVVTDASGAVVANATVTISAPTLIGGGQSTKTNSDGAYRFTVLPAGSYQVAVSVDGFRPVRRTGIRVASAASVTIDFALEVAGVTDALEITGRSPIVDVKSAGVPVRLDVDLLQNLPTARSLAGLINLAPGIAADVSFGGSQKSNEILVDGVRTTEPLFQDPTLRVNQNWVEEVNIVALGAGAEHGGFTGAAASAVLRSGTNRFSGLGEFWTTRPSWLGKNTQELSERLQRTFLSRQLVDWRDSSAQVGGPIVRDRLWFFSGLQHARHEDRPAGFTGPGTRDEREWQGVVKPTFALSPAARLEGFLTPGRHRVTGEYIGVDTPIESSNDTYLNQVAWSARLTWTLRDTTLAEFRQGGYTTDHVEDPHAPATRTGPSPHWDSVLQMMSVSSWNYFDQFSRMNTSSATVTHFADEGPGSGHAFKFGVEFEKTSAVQQYGYPGGRIYFDYAGEPGEVIIWAGGRGTASTGRWSVFAQDVWALTSRLTLNPGIRIEWNRGSVPGKSGVFGTTAIAPRLGLTWDVSRDHRTVARLHYGHYYDPIFASRIMQDDTSGVNPSIFALVVGPEQFVELSRSTTEHRFAIDPDLEHSHVKQLVAGVERELFADFSLQAQYVRRRFDTYMGLIDVGSIWAPATRTDPGRDGTLNTADDGGALSVFRLTNAGNQRYLYTNPDNAFNRYDAMQIVGRKRYSGNWQLQASYTWSKNRGTVGNRWHVNAARYDLGSPGRFVNPNSFINAFGRATFDPTHEAKILGSYRLPWWGGAMVSGVYRYTTGQAYGRRANFQGLRPGQETIRVEPQGAYRAEALNNLALRVEKTVTLPRPAATLGLFFDVFNVWNQAAPNSDVTNAVNEMSGARFGEPNTWTDPRMLRVGLRLMF